MEVQDLPGTAAEREELLRSYPPHELSLRYKDVITAYSVLADRRDTEALKRATFLLWYADLWLNKQHSQSDPVLCESDITVGCPGLLNAINFHAVQLTLWELEFQCGQRYGREPLDTELKWMLDWYYRRTPRFFVGLFLRCLEEHLEAMSAEPPSDLSATAFAGRGLMGHYWSENLLSHGGGTARGTAA